ncbi:MAG TPA: trigger factor [Gammaproteobacteria bacterium]|jgi:trigger factor|uniref:Trigger factor n=2 Tax=Candidatus Macondimonas diazotrophica TaxID=2305248 RepID=A0A4Z0FBA7_9GAMM|nr:trigger factor [Candidatus Macondimonas diazotrophica]HBG30222.1 trigger factor [Gammaproteobacteria bacterium]
MNLSLEKERMQSAVEVTGALERRIRVQVPAQEVDRQVEDRLRSLGPRAKIKGFRPGKAPISVIRRQYGDQVRQEVVEEVLRTSYANAIQEQGLQPAGSPQIEAESLAPGADLAYTAVVEVYPQIELVSVESHKLERPQVTIGEEDVERVLGQIREQQAHFHAVERPAQSGDRIKMDFEGTIDGEAFSGNRGESVEIELGAGRLLADFENALLGATSGQTLDIDLTFPEDYPSAEVAGKTAVFKVTVHEVAEKHLPELTDELALQAGVTEGGIATLRERIRERLEAQAEQAVRAQIKEKVMDLLLSLHDIPVPSALLEQEVDRLASEMAQRMGLQTQQSNQLPREIFADRAQRRVALGLIVGELIKQEAIQPDPSRVDSVIESLVANHEQPDALAQAYRGNREVMQRIQGIVLEDQVVDLLLEKVDVVDVATSFEELMSRANSAAGEEM